MSQSSIATTPTVSEFLNAANWEYDQVGTPADLSPFLVDGHQLTMTNQADAVSAAVWLTPSRQVIVSYEGTQFVGVAGLATNPLFSVGQTLEDTGVAQGQVTPGERDAAAFARQVVTAAAAQGVGSGDVFVTGHSLGGIQAEYAAQQTGLGGIGFESTGLGRSSTDAGTGANFVNVVQDGDPVANYSSDIKAEQPFSPVYAAGGSGALPHYGYVAFIGDPTAEASLAVEAQASNLGAVGLAVTTAAYGADLAAFHIPDVQAHSLGVQLTQVPAGDLVGVRSGPILDAANDDISQLIQATHATLSAALAPSSAVSPTTGPYAGDTAVALSSGATTVAAIHAFLQTFGAEATALPHGGGETEIAHLETLLGGAASSVTYVDLVEGLEAASLVSVGAHVTPAPHVTSDASVLAMLEAHVHLDGWGHLI